MFERVAIVGTGLIGGSFGLALKQHKLAARIVGVGRPETLRLAAECGAIDEGAESLEAGVSGADLIFLATPILAILDVLERVHKAAPAGALVTDAGSTKSRIATEASRVFDAGGASAAGGALFIAGHPMAGKEQRGVAAATADLYRGATWALTPWHRADLETPVAAKFVECIKTIGARPLVLDADVHDEIVAWTSHLPQLTATALASIVGENVEDAADLALAGSGLRDTTRLAESSYRVWRDICLTNDENIGAALSALIAKLEDLRDGLKRRDLETVFKDAQAMRACLNANKD